MTISLQQQLQHLIDTKTKPPGALGVLESIALQAGLIQQTTKPTFSKPHIVVFAGDHGIAATGLVNPYPQAVTAQMVFNFLNGGAAINVFCRANNIHLIVVDAGVNHDFAGLQNSSFIQSKMGYGTNDYTTGPAMTEDVCLQAIEKGKSIVQSIAKQGCTVIGFGEMGISNTSSAALIMSALMQCPVAQCTGRGTGASNEQLNQKVTVLEDVAQKHNLHQLFQNPIGLLATVGGFEIAMMVGAYLQAAASGLVVVVDGFIATAAFMIAQKIEPNIIYNCVFAHNSGEQGHQKMLDHLGVQPLLNLGLRLGEGTGAALAMPLVQAAIAFLNEMASFESAGVNTQTSAL